MITEEQAKDILDRVQSIVDGKSDVEDISDIATDYDLYTEAVVEICRSVQHPYSETTIENVIYLSDLTNYMDRDEILEIDPDYCGP